MRNYWSCTKFADIIRGTKKPEGMSPSGWKQWEATSKGYNPVRYWLAETALDGIQSFLMWPINTAYSAKYYIINRWIDQSHALVAHPQYVKPGQWMDLDYRILHCLFSELVDFVEIEKAYSNFRWDEEKSKKLKWWQGGRWRLRTYRNPEAGIDYLKWETELTADEAPVSQAESAKEVIALYQWWVNIRPNRKDPMDESGWSAYCDQLDSVGVDLFEDDTDTSVMHNQMREMETMYHDEDTEMLIRLIKIRGCLWT